LARLTPFLYTLSPAALAAQAAPMLRTSATLREHCFSICTRCNGTTNCASSSGFPKVVAKTLGFPGLPDGIPIAGIAGDQQAALFGQACFASSNAKCTYGTGAFALMNIGSKPVLSTHGLVTTVAWQIGSEVTYALEGSSFIAGAAVQWLRDGLKIIDSAKDIEPLAASVADAFGTTFVPALAGLGAPYWDADARGLLTGLTRGTTRAHIARATLEGIAFQVEDLLSAMRKDTGLAMATLRVDGGAAANGLLMQLQADYSDATIERPRELESTGRGAAMLAAIGIGLATLASASAMAAPDAKFSPQLTAEKRTAELERWHAAIRKTQLA
jgi:glycerol kinase